MRRRWPHGRSGAKYNLPKAAYWQAYWTIKDCKHLRAGGSCEYMAYDVRLNNFCSFGELKEVKNEGFKR